MSERRRTLRVILIAMSTVWLGVLPVFAQDERQEQDTTQASEDAPDTATTESAEEESLPKVEEVPLPGYEELLSGPRRDWIILLNDRLVVVEPIFPRPNALQRIQAERDEILSDNRRRFSEDGRARLAQLNEISIFLPEDESSTEYTIRRTEIKEVLHHEDLMLRRAAELIKEGDTRKAFELVLVVARRDAAWPGLSDVQTQLTIADVDQQLSNGENERALALIASLYEQSPVPEDAAPLLGRAAAALLDSALAENDYRQARYDLGRIRSIDAKHFAIATGTERLVTLARSLQSEAEAASQAGQSALAAVKIEQAARAWPQLQGLRPVHARLTSKHQRLLVGVPDLAAAKARALSTSADDRVARLTHGDLFEIEGFESVPIYRSIYFERWEPTDLGRQARFQLRPRLPTWAATAPLTASDVVRVLSDRFRQGDTDYDARFADSVQSLAAVAPFTFEVAFRRIPLRAEAKVTRSPNAIPTEQRNSDDLFLRFRESERNSSNVVYRRRESSENGDNRLMEVVERTYPSYEKAVQAFDRGEVRMLTDVPVWDVPRLREDQRYVITKLAVPKTHFLQFHPKSVLSASSELRRALIAAVDSEALLRLVVGQGGEKLGRRVTAPFPSTSLGYDPLVEPRQADLALALALSLAAEKSLGGSVPELTLIAPAEAPGRQVADSLVATWKRIGFSIRLVTPDQLGPTDSWDVAYRELIVLDPVKELGPMITLDPAVEMTSLESLPDWLRQRLLDLERASDAATAQSILIDLHHLLYADARMAPLFEVDQFLVSRGAIRGMPEQPVAVYQHAERWSLPHDYPEETR